MSLSENLRAIRFIGYFGATMIPTNRAALKAFAEGGREAARTVLRERTGRVLEIGGAQLSVVGTENIPSDHCVLMHNEASLVDVMLIHHVLYDHAEVGVGAELFARVPYATELCEKLRIVLFQRGDRKAADEMLDRVTAWVKQGDRMLIAAEGRQQRDGSVGHFKRGGALVAIRAGVPIVPVALAGGPDMLPVGSLRMRPGRLTVSFGKPMPTDGLAEDDAPEFAQRVREEVVRMRDRYTHAPPP